MKTVTLISLAIGVIMGLGAYYNAGIYLVGAIQLGFLSFVMGLFFIGVGRNI